MDQFTKIIRFKAIVITALSKDIAKIYQDNIWKLHRVLWKVLSDRGPQFASRFIEDLIKTLETRRVLLTAYHP